MKQNTMFVIVVVAVVIAVVVIGIAIMDGGKTENINQSANPAPQTQTNTNTNMDQTTELKIEDTKTGTGPAAKTGDSVTVNYTGTFADGTKFDSSLNPGRTPFVFTLGAGNVIQGWDQGVVGMQVGGTRKLVIPPALGYGAQDYNGIPGNSTLYFTIELLKIGQ